MKLTDTRFGAIEISDDDVLDFPFGIFGFPTLHRFVLLPHRSSPSIAWLQSLDQTEVALPVVSAHAFDECYDDATLATSASALGSGDPATLAALLVLTVTPGLPPTVNRKAPIFVDAVTRRGAQLLLGGAPLSTRATFVATGIGDAASASAA